MTTPSGQSGPRRSRRPWALASAVLSGRPVRFLVTSGAGTLCDVGLVLVTQRAGWPVMLSVACGWCTSLIVGFALNRSWVFRSPGGAGARSAVRYLALSALNAVVAIVGVAAVVDRGVPYLAARLASSVILVVLNFVVCRYWVFRPPVPGPALVDAPRPQEISHAT